MEMTAEKNDRLRRAAAAYVEKHRAEQALKVANDKLKAVEVEIRSTYFPVGAYTCTSNDAPTLVTISVSGNRSSGYVLNYMLSEPLHAVEG